MFGSIPVSTPLVAHTGIPGPGPFVATGLFLAGSAAVGGAVWLHTRQSAPPRPRAKVLLAAVGAGCFLLATFLPLLLHANVGFSRPSTSAHLTILSPRPGEVFRGDPATVVVRLRLVGGRIVRLTSLRLVPNEGHIHLSIDSSLVSMLGGLDGEPRAAPGTHVLRAEFVAIDHAPFQPRVLATVSFQVRP